VKEGAVNDKKKGGKAKPPGSLKNEI